MAFTRKMLKALGIEEEKIEQIMDAHTEVTDGLKAERDKFKADAEKLPSVQKELDKVKEDLAAVDKDEYKGKYEAEKAAHDKLKADIADKEAAAKEEAALTAWAKEQGYSEKGAKMIVKKGGYRGKFKLSKDGEIEISDELKAEIEDDWSDYKEQSSSAGTKTENPPAGSGSDNNKTSRAAQIVADYQKKLYGDVKKEG